MTELAKILPSLALVFVVMLLKDLMVSSQERSSQPSKHAPPPPQESHSTASHHSPPPSPSPTADAFEDFGYEEDDDEDYVAPTPSTAALMNNVHLKFVICSS